MAWNAQELHMVKLFFTLIFCVFFRKTLQLAQELGDRAVEAQACYSLGNTYTLLRDYPTAIHYHLKHLGIAQELSDRVGEGRACWSLGNAYSAINNHEKALQYANCHLLISKEVSIPHFCLWLMCKMHHSQSLRDKFEIYNFCR